MMYRVARSTPWSFMDKREDFLGSTSSMYGVRRGYVESRDWRRERWMEDLSFCLGEGVRLCER